MNTDLIDAIDKQRKVLAKQKKFDTASAIKLVVLPLLKKLAENQAMTEAAMEEAIARVYATFDIDPDIVDDLIERLGRVATYIDELLAQAGFVEKDADGNMVPSDTMPEELADGFNDFMLDLIRMSEATAELREVIDELDDGEDEEEDEAISAAEDGPEDDGNGSTAEEDPKESTTEDEKPPSTQEKTEDNGTHDFQEEADGDPPADDGGVAAGGDP